MKTSARQRHMYAERLRRFYPSELVPNVRESKNIRSAIQCTRGYDVYSRLAELIDPPICKNEGTSDYFICSKCKFQHPVAGKHSYDDCGKPVISMVRFRYCPNCGAAVIADA